jgi:membrane associated rhomboid family serine protease
MQRFIRVKGLLAQQGPLLALILFISIVFALQKALGAAAYIDFMVLPSEIARVWDDLRADGVAAGGAWRLGTLLSYAFLHGSFEHLMFNMLYLWIFAALAADLLGHPWVILIFCFTAICGGICHVALNAGEFVPMLGASGAVMGFEGLYLGMAVRWLLPDPHVWPMARPIPPGQLAALGVIGLVMDYMGFLGGTLGVAYGAHLGGFVGGLLLACTVPMPRAAGVGPK